MLCLNMEEIKTSIFLLHFLHFPSFDRRSQYPVDTIFSVFHSMQHQAQSQIELSLCSNAILLSNKNSV